MCRLFDYLNRYWVRCHCKSGISPLDGVHESVFEMGIAMWKEGVQCEKVSRALYEAMWAEIVQGRGGQCADYISVRQVLDIYQDLGLRGEASVYGSDFAAPFVEDTYHYYARESEELIARNDFPGYVAEAHRRIESELETAAKYGAADTMLPLCRACENAFVAQEHVQLQLQRFFDELLVTEGRKDELRSLFHLLKRVDGALDEGRRRFQDLVAFSGTEAVATFFREAATASSEAKDRRPDKPMPPPDAMSFLDTLIGQCTHFWDMAMSCFEGDASFLAAAERGFVIFCNTNRTSAELLARCCHKVLDRGAGGAAASEEEAERVVSLVVTVLRYILDKDVFQGHYLKLLAKRLIEESSASQPAEEVTIQALKTVCTPDFTNRLSRMLTDHNLSRDMDETYVSSLESAVAASSGPGQQTAVVSHRVIVLTAGTWPDLSSNRPHRACLVAPPPIQACMDMYDKFYSSLYQGRRLTWNLELSRADVRCTFDKMYEIQMSTVQLAFMLVFNHCESATLENIAAALGIPATEAAICAMSLVKAKLLIVGSDEAEDGWELLVALSNDDESRKGPESVEVFVNQGFTSKRARVKLPSASLLPLSSHQARSAAVSTEVAYDRKAIIQAVIVRIMKARRELGHEALVMELFDQVSSRWHALPCPDLPLPALQNSFVVLDLKF